MRREKEGKGIFEYDNPSHTCILAPLYLMTPGTVVKVVNS